MLRKKKGKVTLCGIIYWSTLLGLSVYYLILGIMAEEEVDYSKLPLEERCTHKVRKINLKGGLN